MAKSYLDKNQSRFLRFFSQEKKLLDKFYLTGGTALSEYYLHHRRSVDLDFFCESEFSPESITPFIKKSKAVIKYKKIDFQQAFNRNIYQIIFSKNSFLKLEFTYFPFPQVEKPKIISNIKVDSLLDIAVNKVFTVSQKPRGRDFFDLYYIITKKKWCLSELVKKAKLKFDWHVDPLQLGTNMMQVKEIKDDPILEKATGLEKVQNFIIKEAKKIGKKVLTDA